MAVRRAGGGSKTGAGQGSEPGWFEWLEHRPVGAFGAAIVVAGWIVLALLYFFHVWSLEVVFFIAVGLLTFVLGCLSLFAALVERRRATSTAVLRFPASWDERIEDYFRWLTPVAFMFGLIFAHYFWH
ncbi:MAG: hypothetical protein PVS2B1_04950 [Candidatus Dormibacteraceae bacterium]